jgi:hypothetical protein
VVCSRPWHRVPPSLAGDRTSYGGFGLSFVYIFSLSLGFIFHSCVCLPPTFVLCVVFRFSAICTVDLVVFLLLCSFTAAGACASGFLFLCWCFVFCHVYCGSGGGDVVFRGDDVMVKYCGDDAVVVGSRCVVDVACD